MNRRPTTVEDAFHVSRRRFVPRVLTLFALYLAAVLAPDLARLIPDFAPDEPPGVEVTVPSLTVSPPPTVVPTDQKPTVEPVRTRDGWTLDQPQFGGHLVLRAEPGPGSFRRIAQTFRSPGRGANLTSVGVHVRFANGPLTIALLEIRGDTPVGGRRLRAVELASSSLPAEAFVRVRIEPLPLRSDRRYAVALLPGGGSAEAWIGHLSEDVYGGGGVWIDPAIGWFPADGELAFALEFVR